MYKLFIFRDFPLIVFKSGVTFVLPYFGQTSLNLRTRLRRTTEGNLPYCKLKGIFRSMCRFNNLFCFKYLFEKKNQLWSNLLLCA